MADWWLKLGCFLTGYKYSLIKHCSYASAKKVIKYNSAILIVSLIWFFIGYSFTQRYLRGNVLESLAAAIILSFIVIQVERQIILTFGKNKYIIGFRISLAVVMAILGSIITDQITFGQDIEKQKIPYVDSLVNKSFSNRSLDLDRQINKIDSDIARTANEIETVGKSIKDKPQLTSVISTNQIFPNDSSRNNSNRQTIQIPNPGFSRIIQLDTIINSLRREQTKLQQQKLSLRENLRKEFNSKIGFLDELKILFSILGSSWISLVFWILLWVFFLSIELLVVFTKLADEKNDYEYMLIHQMNIRIDQLKAINNEQK